MVADEWPEIVDDADDRDETCDLSPVFSPEKQQLLDALAQGFVPDIEGTGVQLLGGEREHLCFDDVAVLQRQVVAKEYRGESGGLSLYDNGFAVHFGETVGHTVDRSADVRLGVGRLVLTSQRIVFLSRSTSFALVWADVLNVTRDRWDRIYIFQACAPAGSPPLMFAGMDADILGGGIQTCRRRSGWR